MALPLRHRWGLRHLLRHPWNLLLPVLGIGLGVAITVALDLAIQSSREAFRVSTETVTGRATHQITAPAGGVPDTLPALLLRSGLGVEAAPVVEGWVAAPAAEGDADRPPRPLRVLGVDPFSEAPFRPWLAGTPGGELDGTALVTEAGAVVLSQGTAAALAPPALATPVIGSPDGSPDGPPAIGPPRRPALEVGDRFPVQVGARVDTLHVVGILEPADDFSRRGLADLLVMDIAGARGLLGRDGSAASRGLDRVDLRFPSNAGPELEEAVEALFPAGVELVPAGSRERTMEEMIRAFDLNLTALSLLGLLFGVFLIYNTMTFSVVRRRRTFGTLRALGVTRGELLRGVLAEAAVLGALGAAVGLLLGILLGRGLVQLVTRTINDLYFVVSVEGLLLPPEVLLRGGLLGIGATLAAALLPGWEAASVLPREALARSTVESRVRRLVPRAAVAGAVLLALGATLLGFTSRSLGAAFTGLFAVVVGVAIMVPLAAVAVVAALRPLLRRTVGILGAMAARGVVTSLSRTAPALAALVIAVSVTLGLGVMIQSFRGSVEDWLDVTLQADLYVSAPGGVSARTGSELPPGVAREAPSVDGIAGVSLYRRVDVTSSYGHHGLVGLELDPRGEGAFDFVASLPDVALVSAFRGGAGGWVSEPFAFRHRLAPGDTVRLPSPTGEVEIPVLAVFRDYGAEAGTVMVDRALYRERWEDDRVTSMGVFLEDGLAGTEAAGRVEDALRALAGPTGAGPAGLVVRSNRQLRSLTLEVFDRTFEVTRVLRLLAFLVAFVGVYTALTALQLERSRELGVLRANGMTPGQTWGLVTSQTGLMGLVSGLLALPVGLLMAAIMIHVVNRRSFGWTLEMTVGTWLPIQAVLLALAGALLAGIHPSWRMSRTPPSQALRDE